MTLGLRIVIVSQEDSSLDPTAHVRWHTSTYNSSCKGSNVLAYEGTSTHVAYTPTV